MSSGYTSPIDQLIRSTVRIRCFNQNGESTGSGFIFVFSIDEKYDVPCIITNKHVINGAQQGEFCLALKGNDGLPMPGKNFTIQFDNFEEFWLRHPDPSIDLAIIPLAPILDDLDKKGMQVHFVSLSESIISDKSFLKSLSSMENVIMIGYPNGIWDQHNNLPVIRKGITATHAGLLWNAKAEFLIDAACFPGSSGSPVFLADIGSCVDFNEDLHTGNRISLLDVLYAGPQYTAMGEVKIVNVPTANVPIVLSSIPNNLGMVIHSSKILDFKDVLRNLLTKSG